MRGRYIARLIAAAAFGALTFAGAASAQDQRGIDPNQGDSLVEVMLPDKAAAMRLQLAAEEYGIEFNEHYLRRNGDGSVAVSVFASEDELQKLADDGYELGVTIEGPATWRERIADRKEAVREENRAEAAALDEGGVSTQSHEDEIVVLRVDYFENYAGRFLSVEAKTRLATVNPANGAYTGPTLTFSFDRGPGTPIDSTPRTMDLNIDPDTTPDTYIEHRDLVRIGEVDTTDPPRPSKIRIGSSTGATMEADVNTWLGGGLPPMKDGYLKDFSTRYLDPTELYARFDALAAEFPNISELVPLPNDTNGYQRRAQATMSGTTGSGSTVPGSQTASAVVLTSRAWGHEGGNDITAEFVNSGVPNAPLAVTVTGNDIRVSLATNAASEQTSTAAQVVEAINTSPAASALVKAITYRGNAGAGIVQPRANVNLSDFLTTSTNAHVQRGPFEYSVMRIGKKRDGSKVGVFLYCQQHAREWATPLTCLETAEQLLRNYAIDPATKKLVDDLDIFILPASNPDGGHYSMHNFPSQRKNMTNHCVEGGKEGDDPFAANFWAPRVNPGTGVAYTNSDPASRTAWGTDPNRNNTIATLFDGYIGASHSCTADLHGAGGGIRARDPERAVDRGHVLEHQVLQQHPQLRRLLHVGAGLLPAQPRRG